MSNYVRDIESVFEQFKVDAVVAGSTAGASVPRFEVKVGAKVKMSKIAGLQREFAYATAAESVRVLAPIPGKSAVGIELPNDERRTVTLEAAPEPANPLTIYVGEDVEGGAVTADLGKMPHLLVAGTTGSGKSSFINSMLVTLLKADPEQVKMILVDPKQIELTPYDGIPHLLEPVITEVDVAIAALRGLIAEMEDRYAAMREAGVRSIDTLGLPYIVVVVDELANLMMTAPKEIEASVVRLAQEARAAGIHLVLATQRPSVDVVTGLIKANVPSRLAFSTSSLVDSRVVLDEAGAEQLLGMGDGLFKPVGARSSVRVQSAYVSDEEVAQAVRGAQSKGAVEEMVETLHPPLPSDGTLTVLELLNQMIEQTEAAVTRVEDHLVKLTAKGGLFSSKGDKLKLFTDTPGELGAAGDVMVSLARDLRDLREEGLKTA